MTGRVGLDIGLDTVSSGVLNLSSIPPTGA
jgi:hypothetical protein